MPKAVSSNPSTVYWVDIFSHIFASKIVMFTEETKVHKKRPSMAHFLINYVLKIPQNLSR